MSPPAQDEAAATREQYAACYLEQFRRELGQHIPLRTAPDSDSVTASDNLEKQPYPDASTEDKVEKHAASSL